MRCVAVVAINMRTACKTRLAGVLAAAERVSLARKMLDHVLQELARAGKVDEIVVLSPERDLIRSDIQVHLDPGVGLNNALKSYCQSSALNQIDLVLVLPADLPFASASDIDAFVSGGDRHTVAIAPDESGLGTNAILLPAGSFFEFRFGVSSLNLHCREARRVGLQPVLVRVPTLAFDLDEPRHLHRYYDADQSAEHLLYAESLCSSATLIKGKNEHRD